MIYAMEEIKQIMQIIEFLISLIFIFIFFHKIYKTFDISLKSAALWTILAGLLTDVISLTLTCITGFIALHLYQDLYSIIKNQAQSKNPSSIALDLFMNITIALISNYLFYKMEYFILVKKFAITKKELLRNIIKKIVLYMVICEVFFAFISYFLILKLS